MNTRASALVSDTRPMLCTTVTSDLSDSPEDMSTSSSPPSPPSPPSSPSSPSSPPSPPPPPSLIDLSLSTLISLSFRYSSNIARFALYTASNSMCFFPPKQCFSITSHTTSLSSSLLRRSPNKRNPCSANSSLVPGRRFAHLNKSRVVINPCLPANRLLLCRLLCRSSIILITLSEKEGASAHRFSKIIFISKFGMSST